MNERLENLFRACIVRITTDSASGAGFFIAPGTILTCAHLAGDGSGLSVRWDRDNQKSIPIPVSRTKVLLPSRGRPIPALDHDYPDIAVLSVQESVDHPCVGIDVTWPQEQDEFQVYGYPREGGAVRLTPARLTYRGTHGIAPMAYLDLASDTIKPGMSGAAVLNLRSGGVCGVIVGSKHISLDRGALVVPWNAVVEELGEVLDSNRRFHAEDKRWSDCQLRSVRSQVSREANVTGYLRTLINWLNVDPWPQDRRFKAPALTPAFLERTMKVTSGGDAFDADALASSNSRLVVLGGPGSGKTWMAKRTARRCAEAALQLVDSGTPVDEIELPLFTSCSRLFRTNGDVRHAVVSSALDQLADLGGSFKVNDALLKFFTERNGPTLLVIDSLDEAEGDDTILRQVAALPWRILLTSRPSSWNMQIALDPDDASQREVELLPLRYPEDVESFIKGWFTGEPERAADLIAQIKQKRTLQYAATVPLILAFYCIVGGDRPLPEHKHKSNSYST